MSGFKGLVLAQMQSKQVRMYPVCIAKNRNATLIHVGKVAFPVKLSFELPRFLPATLGFAGFGTNGNRRVGRWPQDGGGGTRKPGSQAFRQRFKVRLAEFFLLGLVNFYSQRAFICQQYRRV